MAERQLESDDSERRRVSKRGEMAGRNASLVRQDHAHRRVAQRTRAFLRQK